MNKKINILYILTAFILISCGNKDNKQITENTNTPISVKVKKVTNNNNTPFITASGKVQATNSANLSTRMMGFVTKTYVNVGDKVVKGQLLLSINNTDLQAKRAQVNATIIKAEAGFLNAEKDYNRYKNLFTQNSVSQKEMDDVTAHYNIAKASLRAAKEMKNEINAQFAYANIRAPFTGVVTNKFIKQGDMANPGMPLISVEGKKGFEVVAMIPESEISKIKKGIKVNATLKSIKTTVKGIVTEVSSSAKNTGGQYLVKIKLNKTNTKILSGMYASIQFPIEKTTTTNNMVLIPTKAIVNRGELQGIYTVSKNNKALLRWLRLGKTFGNNVEVLSGLKNNESYIVSSNEKLYNGAVVVIE